MVRKESAANDDQEMLEGSEAETNRSVVGILMYFKRHRFDLHYAAKSLAMASSSRTKGHMRTFETSFALHSRHARHASGVGSAPRTVDGIGWLVWMDRGQTSTKNGGRLLVVCSCLEERAWLGGPERRNQQL